MELKKNKNTQPNTGTGEKLNSYYTNPDPAQRELAELQVNGAWQAMSPGARESYLKKWSGAPDTAATQSGYTSSDLTAGYNSGTTGSTSAAAYQQLLNQQAGELAKTRNNALSYLDRSYEDRLSALNTIRDKTLGGYLSDYNNQLQSLNGQYNVSRDLLGQDREKQLAEAYASKMAAQRNLGQQLAASGVTGGMSESTMMGLANNYGQSRNKLETSYAQSLAEIEQQKSAQAAELLREYNSNKTGYESSWQNNYQQLMAEQAAARMQQEQYYNDLLQNVRLAAMAAGQ